MWSLIRTIWKNSSSGLRFNLAFKALASVVTSFIDIGALIIFAQLLSSLVLSDITFLIKIANLLGLYRNDMKVENIYLISILLIIFLVILKAVLILAVAQRR